MYKKYCVIELVVRILDRKTQLRYMNKNTIN